MRILLTAFRKLSLLVGVCIFAGFSVDSVMAASQLDSFIRRFQTVSGIHSQSPSSDLLVPLQPFRIVDTSSLYSGNNILLNPSIPGPAPSGTPTLERDLDLGLNADVLRVSVGRNQYLISIAALPCEEIEGCMRHPTRSVVFYETIWCGVTAKDVFALKSFPAGNNLIAQQLTTYSTQPRHRVSAKALVMLDEIHNLPFETVFGFFVEKDTGTIVCKTVIRGWGRTISVTHKGETFEASFEKAIRKVIRDKDLLIAEDLIRNQPRVFTGLFPGIIRGSSSLAAPVRTFGRVVQMHRSGTLNDPTAIDSLRALAERVNGWQRLEQTEDEEEEVDSTFGMPPNPLMNRK